jgi:hypothetical protein
MKIGSAIEKAGSARDDPTSTSCSNVLALLKLLGVISAVGRDRSQYFAKLR